MRWIAPKTGAFRARASSSGSRGDLSVVQIVLNLPRRDMADVAVPLGALRGDEVVEDVLAERIAHQRASLELIKRFAEIARQLVDPQVPPLAMAHLVDVLVHRRPRIRLLVDPVESRAQDRGERKVRVAGLVWHSQLDARVRAARDRHANQRTAVVL